MTLRARIVALLMLLVLLAMGWVWFGGDDAARPATVPVKTAVASRSHRPVIDPLLKEKEEEALVVAAFHSKPPVDVPTPPSPTTDPPPDASWGLGEVRGTIHFEGKPPAPEYFEHRLSPLCAPEGITLSRVVVSGSGGLADVFVEVVGTPDLSFAVPPAVAVIQQGLGASRVYGVMRKQALEIMNNDECDNHFAYAVPRKNMEISIGTGNRSAIRKCFENEEPAIAIACPPHPWERTFVFCMSRPYFAVTSIDGTFAIRTRDLPDGLYGIRLWHETLGAREGVVCVENGGGRYDFTFRP